MNHAIAPVDYAKLTSSTEAPNTAFEMKGEFKFADDSKDASSRPISILARTRTVVYHWWWGRCVHDFDGMQTKSTVRLDWCHDDDICVGIANEYPVDDDGLWLNGKLISRKPGDKAAEIMQDADVGIPFEGSIAFYSHDLVLEYVPEGTTVLVNGGEFEGPGVVFRKWRLRACAVCPHGYDADTEANFSDAAVASKTKPFTWKESPAMTTTPAPASQQSAAGDTTTTNPATTQLTADQVRNEERVKIQAELTRFSTHFGAQGPTYFAENLSFEDAAIKHIAALNTQLTESNTKRTEAEGRLATAGSTFGAQAVNTGDPAETQTPKAVTSLTQARTQAAAAKKPA